MSIKYRRKTTRTPARRRRITFIARTKRIIKKPTIVRFRKSDGTIAKFKATKIVQKPEKVNFNFKKKRYKK